MKQSEKIDIIAPAIVKAKKGFSKAKQSRTNSHLGNTYATLGDVLDAIEPSLNDNDIMVIQSMLDSSTATEMHLETMLMHSCGQFMAFQFNMPIEKRTAQAYGSTISYARRYALAAALGISQTDDDAEIAKRRPEDVKKLAKAVSEPDQLRKIYSDAKKSLSAAEFKIVEPYLLERSAEISAEANKSLSEEVSQTGFNPNKPNVTVNAKTQVEAETKTKQDIESFE